MEDVVDIFQDGLVVFFNKVCQVDFWLIVSLKILFYVICCNIWFMCLCKFKRELLIIEVYQEMVGLDVDVFYFLEENDCNQLVFRGLLQLGDDCWQVLQLYYFEKCWMKIIVEMMGYFGEQVVKNKKLCCMCKLCEWVLNQLQVVEMMY